jgi:hypothetical protein
MINNAFVRTANGGEMLVHLKASLFPRPFCKQMKFVMVPSLTNFEAFGWKCLTVLGLFGVPLTYDRPICHP